MPIQPKSTYNTEHSIHNRNSTFKSPNKKLPNINNSQPIIPQYRTKQFPNN